jgi:tetratricopeptide (TPR) repeat protein
MPEALAAYSTSMEGMARDMDHLNHWLAPDRYTNRLNAAWQSLYEAQLFDEALKLVQHADWPEGRTDGMLRQARTLERWGHSRLRDSEDDFREESVAFHDDEQRHLREAGELYRELAELRGSVPDRQEALWNAGRNLLEGGDYPTALAAVSDYLQTNPERSKCEALVNSGRALMGLGRFGEALDRFDRSSAEPMDDALRIYRDYLRGQCYLRLGKLHEAEATFREIVDSGRLDPASEGWRRSLISLGKVLVQMGRYEEAVQKLSAAAKRIPDDSQAIEASYWIGEALRLGAVSPAQSLESARTDAARAHYEEEMLKRLTSSASLRPTGRMALPRPTTKR